MAQDSKWSVHDNIWHFSVSDPQLHRKGFTVYKVTCKTFPIKAPETLSELVCWKRYNDFKTLYKSLLALHKALHRRDAFPDFAKPKLFGRFDDDVIEERRKSAADLLNFVSTQPHLYKSLVFKQFLEDGTSPTSINPKGLDILIAAGEGLPRSDGNPPPDLVPSSAGLDRVGSGAGGDSGTPLLPEDVSGGGVSGRSHPPSSPAVLRPTPVDSQPEAGPAAEPESGGGAPPPSEMGLSKLTDLASLEGTWNFPQVADNISLNSSNGNDTADTDDDISNIDEDTENEDEESSAIASSLPDTDLTFFDPISHDASAVQPSEDLSGSGIPRSNSWLLKGLNLCAEMGEDHGGAGAHGADGDGLCDSGDQTVSSMSTGSTVTEGSTDQTMSASEKTSSGEMNVSAEFEFVRTMSQSSDGSKVECGKGDLDLSTEWQSRSGSFSAAQAGPAAAFGSRSVTYNSGKNHQDQSQPQRQQQQQQQQQAEYGKQRSSRRSSRSHSVNSGRSPQGSDKRASSSSGGSNKSTPSRVPRGNLLRRLVTSGGAAGSSSKGSGSQTGVRMGKQRSATEHSVTSMDLGGKEDYIYLAASQICMAQNSEVNGDFEVAFAYYKSGVGILLQGVQGDTNKSRRDAVRRKTAQYLMKAEDLFNRHLATETVDERRWGADSFLSPSLDLDPSFAFIRGSVRELRNFQVLGTIDKVVLVRDKGTDETFVIKSIPKSTPDTERTQSILPTSCPHMVSLHRFFETDSCVFLLLQYASGGKLWTYIGDYLHSNRDRNCHSNVRLEVDASPARNVYSGSKVESDTQSHEDGLSETKHSSSDALIDNFPTASSSDKPGVVQSSEGMGAMRFSMLQRSNSTSAGETNAAVSSPPSTQTVVDKVSHDVSDLGSELSPNTLSPSFPRTESFCEAENKDQFNDSGLESIPKSATKVPLSRRLSNLSDDVYAVSPETFSPPTPGLCDNDEEMHFQKLLVETRHNIEDFSINSFDSEDHPPVARINSSSSSCIDRISSIPEDPDCIHTESEIVPEGTVAESNNTGDMVEDFVFSVDCNENPQRVSTGKGDANGAITIQDSISGRTLVARHISVDQTSSFSLLSQEAQDLIKDAKKRHSSFSGVPAAEGSHQSVSVYAPTFNSDDLIRSSQDLLKHVDSVLCETNSSSGGGGVHTSDAATLEVSSAPAQPSSQVSTFVEAQPFKQAAGQNSTKARPLTKQPSSPTTDSSAEEPSIYDINRSSDDDPDESSEKESISELKPGSLCVDQPTNSSVTSPETNTASTTTTTTATITARQDTSNNVNDSSQEAFKAGDDYSCTDGSDKPRIKPNPPTSLGSKGLSGSPLTHPAGSSNRKLSLSRMDSKDLTRSASFECDLKSPTRNRARTVADMFERLDSAPSEQVRIPETSIRKWTAQMVAAVSRLHSLGIVCRDLKPSNILLGEGGQVTLTYFCHLGHGDQELDWEAVDNIYAAPEVSSIGGYDKSCDWWSIGALLFELVVGRTLSECHPGGITSHTCLYIPTFVSDEARGLLEGLLKHNPNERLGAGMAGAEEIKAHPFFSGIDWHQMEYS